MLNLGICNCEGAVICCLDPPLEKKTCHPSFWEYCQQSAFFGNCLSQEIHLAHGHISLGFTSPALWPWLRTAPRACSAGSLSPSLWVRGLQPARLLCSWNVQARYRSGLPVPSPGDLPSPGTKPRSPHLLYLIVYLDTFLPYYFLFSDYVSPVLLVFPFLFYFLSGFLQFLSFHFSFFNWSIFVPKYYVAGIPHS